MATVDKEISVMVCDCCGEHAYNTCEVCGMDLCRRCTGTISLVHPRLCETEPKEGCCGRIGPFRIKDDKDLHRFYNFLDMRRGDENTSLCPVHYQQIIEDLRVRLLVAIEQEHEKDVRR